MENSFSMQREREISFGDCSLQVLKYLYAIITGEKGLCYELTNYYFGASIGPPWP